MNKAAWAEIDGLVTPRIAFAEDCREGLSLSGTESLQSSRVAVATARREQNIRGAALDGITDMGGVSAARAAQTDDFLEQTMASAQDSLASARWGAATARRRELAVAALETSSASSSPLPAHILRYGGTASLERGSSNGGWGGSSSGDLSSETASESGDEEFFTADFSESTGPSYHLSCNENHSQSVIGSAGAAVEPPMPDEPKGSSEDLNQRLADLLAGTGAPSLPPPLHPKPPERLHLGDSQFI